MPNILIMKPAKEIYQDIHNKYNAIGGRADKYDIEAMETYAEQFKQFYIEKFEEHRLKHAKDGNFARAQAILDLMEVCNLYTEKK